MKQTDDIQTMVKTRAQECIAVRIRLLSRMITHVYDSAMKPYGVKLNQMSMLALVFMKSGIGFEAICKRLKMEKSTASRNIERLKKAGWLEVAHAHDERKKVLRVTPAGETLLREVHGAWEKAQAEAEKLLGSAGAAAICRCADEIWSRDRRR